MCISNLLFLSVLWFKNNVCNIMYYTMNIACFNCLNVTVVVIIVNMYVSIMVIITVVVCMNIYIGIL